MVTGDLEGRLAEISEMGREEWEPLPALPEDWPELLGEDEPLMVNLDEPDGDYEAMAEEFDASPDRDAYDIAYRATWRFEDGEALPAIVAWVAAQPDGARALCFLPDAIAGWGDPDLHDEELHQRTRREVVRYRQSWTRRMPRRRRPRRRVTHRRRRVRASRATRSGADPPGGDDAPLDAPRWLGSAA